MYLNRYVTLPTELLREIREEWGKRCVFNTNRELEISGTSGLRATQEKNQQPMVNVLISCKYLNCSYYFRKRNDKPSLSLASTSLCSVNFLRYSVSALSLFPASMVMAKLLLLLLGRSCFQWGRWASQAARLVWLRYYSLPCSADSIGEFGDDISTICYFHEKLT